jgi:hypothetical protein
MILPRFEQINFDNEGVKILDRELHRVADVYFQPKGVKCNLCNAENCVHIDFALSQPQIQKVIRARKKEGWKLPEIS